MSEGQPGTSSSPRAGAMRERFRAVPKDVRDAHQPWSIRMWRGLSWLERAVQAMLRNERMGNTLALLQELFERLYVLRVQVFHGAATSGSKYKTQNIEDAIAVLGGLVPVMIDIMLAAGPEQDWGDVCYPPIHED